VRQQYCADTPLTYDHRARDSEYVRSASIRVRTVIGFALSCHEDVVECCRRSWWL
jgi:hypothetical protein